MQKEGERGLEAWKRLNLGIEDIFQRHNQNPQMQSCLPDLVIMHHMCIQSMHAYEKHRDTERKRESKSELASAGD